MAKTIMMPGYGHYVFHYFNKSHSYR